MKALIIISVVGLLAYLLVKRTSVGGVNLDPSDTPYTPGAVGTVALGGAGILCRGIGSLDISGQCSQLANNPVYRAQVSQAAEYTFSKHGAKNLGGTAVSEIRLVSQPWKAITGFNSGPNHACKNWKGQTVPGCVKS